MPELTDAPGPPAQEIVKKAGGKLSDDISGKTDIVVTGDEKYAFTKERKKDLWSNTKKKEALEKQQENKERETAMKVLDVKKVRCPRATGVDPPRAFTSPTLRTRAGSSSRSMASTSRRRTSQSSSTSMRARSGG